MPAYLQELWVGERMLEENWDGTVLEAAGVVHGSTLMLSRVGVGDRA